MMSVSRRRRAQVVLLVLTAASIMVVLAGASAGAASIGPGTTFFILLRRLGLPVAPTWSELDEAIILAIRLPRVLLAFVVGATLAISGAAFQALFRNPMADPFVLGVSPGAAFGAALAIVLGLDVRFAGVSAVPLMAFLASLATAWMVYFLSKKRGALPVETLLLTGIAFGAALSSLTSLAMVLFQKDMHLVYFWVMGGLSSRSWADLIMVLPYALTAMLVLMALSRELNILVLGDEEAFHLGVNVDLIRKIILAAASLGAAAAVSAAGIVGFVGLIVPHTVRMMTGPDHRYHLPSSLLAGGFVVVLADLFARTVLSPQEIPLGIVTSLLGAPFFLWLLRRKERVI